MKKTTPGLVSIRSLSEPWPWTMGVAGLVKWLSWETENILGITKTALVKRVVTDALRYSEEGRRPPDEVLQMVQCAVTEEKKRANVAKEYDSPRGSSLISAMEAQRRLRFFSEDYLNKEFDIFLALLPDHALARYLSTHFEGITDSAWQVYGNSSDFEESTGIQFMQMDTLAYQADSNLLVAFELKIDAVFTAEQVSKYCFMAAYLEKIDRVASDVHFKLLVVAPELYQARDLLDLRREASNLLDREEFPKKRVTPDEMRVLVPRVRELVDQMELRSTTWQDLGGHFQRTLSDGLEAGEMYRKLVSGFLWSLGRKQSKRSGRRIYQ